MDEKTLKDYYEIYTSFWKIFRQAVSSDDPPEEIYRQASIEADEIYHKHISLDGSLILDLYRATIRAIVKIKEG
jgi:hypothetical protein